MGKMKLCWWCKYFYFEEATPHYSEQTPGDRFIMECKKNYWEFNVFDTTREKFAEILESAETCKDFEKYEKKP